MIETFSPPFLHELVPVRSRIFGLKGEDRFIVRLDGNLFDERLSIPDHQRSESLFDELRDKYNIAAPRHRSLIGVRNGKPTVYVISEKIHGTPFGELTEIPQGFDLNPTFCSLIDYHADKLRKGLFSDSWDERFLADIGMNQFVLGRRVGESEDRLYLVDVDPIYTSTKDVSQIRGSAQRLRHSIVGLQNNFPRQDFSRSLDKFTRDIYSLYV